MSPTEARARNLEEGFEDDEDMRGYRGDDEGERKERERQGGIKGAGVSGQQT